MRVRVCVCVVRAPAHACVRNTHACTLARTCSRHRPTPSPRLNTHHPSSSKHTPPTHTQFTFLLDDIGIPANYRRMEGFGVHTYTLLAKDGRVTYVKFHWKPAAGVKSLMDDEAEAVGGANHSHATQVRVRVRACVCVRGWVRVCMCACALCAAPRGYM